MLTGPHEYKETTHTQCAVTVHGAEGRAVMTMTMTMMSITIIMKMMVKVTPADHDRMDYSDNSRVDDNKKDNHEGHEEHSRKTTLESRRLIIEIRILLFICLLIYECFFCG